MEIANQNFFTQAVFGSYATAHTQIGSKCQYDIGYEVDYPKKYLN